MLFDHQWVLKVENLTSKEKIFLFLSIVLTFCFILEYSERAEIIETLI